MQNNLEYIKMLSLNDKKTLTQKTLKLAEEVGELSKVVLPYEGAYATNHRVVNKQKLLEECVDIFLVNQSIIYDLGFTDEEFNNLVMDKAQVWNGLQVKEDRALANGDTMPYEIHITVNAEDGIDIEEFKLHCVALGVKPILLDLQDQAGKSVMDDVMTSSKLFGNNGEAFDEMKRISFGLKEFGYNVIREKIEASYWHQKAPFKEDCDTEMPEGCYFECHLNILCTDERMKQLSEIAYLTKCHLSKNAFKKFSDGSFTIMMTYRSYTEMYEDFEEKLDSLKKLLIASEFNIEKEVVEFSIYDTKTSHDNKWLEA
jgi:NTP pyrophosphatase (non-canonical NTP hydrolase)